VSTSEVITHQVSNQYETFKQKISEVGTVEEGELSS